MNQITIIIPTRNRIKKITRAIRSIPKDEFIDIIVVCDDDHASVEILTAIFSDRIFNDKQLAILNTDKHLGSVACRNLITPIIEDGLIYLTDDMEFDEKFNFKQLLEEFNNNFSDDDGVLGIKQNLPNFHPTGIALVGQRFLRRYPGQKLFNPDYWTFSCQEIYWLARKYNIFSMSEFSVNHFHPAFNPELKDQTHEDARKYKNEDMKLMKKRELFGEIWGDMES